MLVKEKIDVFNRLINDATRDELVWMNGFLAGVLKSPNVVDVADAPAVAIDKLTVLYASETGNAKSLATRFAANAKKMRIKTKLAAVEQYRLSDLSKEEFFILVISTQGDGEPTIVAHKFCQALQAESLLLPNLKYGVLGLGDSSYPLFCQAGVEVDAQLALRGAKRVAPLQKCDTDYEAYAFDWFEKSIELFSQCQAGGVTNAAVEPISVPKQVGKKIYKGEILTNLNLNDADSNKQTHHIEIEATGLSYSPGDALGIVAENATQLVTDILNLSKLDADTIIAWKGDQLSLLTLLKTKLQIVYLPQRVVNKYASIVAQEIPDTRIGLFDLLKIYPVKDKEEFLQVVHILEPIAPRLYSISSSPEAHSDEVHITVAKDKFSVNDKEAFGLCSGYLCELPLGAKFDFYIHPNKAFRMPAEDKDVIMIGPGTGIAPFRSFLFERDAVGASGKNWLFFGDQHFTSDFLYQTEIQSFLETGVLSKFNGAFSRDQQEKVYVQHKMLQEAAALFSWIENGAYIYLCGAKSPMSFDVEKTLVEIIAAQKQLNTEEAAAYLNEIKEEGRFLTDVY